MQRVTLVLGLFALLAVAAFAQGPVVKAKIPFEFVAAGKTLPAGNYLFRLDSGRLVLRNTATGDTVVATVQTRLAGTSGPSEARVTFDVSDGKNFLEAVWPSSSEEGYLIHTVKGQHTHQTVKSE